MPKPCVFVRNERAEAVTTWLCASSLSWSPSFHHLVLPVSIAEIPNKAETWASLPLATWQGFLTGMDPQPYNPEHLGSSLLQNCVELDVKAEGKVQLSVLREILQNFRTSDTQCKSLSTSMQSGNTLGITFSVSLFPWLMTELLMDHKAAVKQVSILSYSRRRIILPVEVQLRGRRSREK